MRHKLLWQSVAAFTLTALLIYGCKKEGSTEVQAPTATWVSLANMPYSAGDLAAAEVNGKIYVFGGHTFNDVLDKVCEYDIAANTWTDKGSMPHQRAGHAAVAMGGKIYIIGGYDNWTSVNTVHVYDPATGTWSAKQDMGTSLGAPTFAFVIGTKIYTVSWGTDVKIRVYDPAADTWELKAATAHGRDVFAACLLGGKIYVVGGAEATGYGTQLDTIYATVECFDPSTETWSSAPPLSSARWELEAAACNGKIYAMGGETQRAGGAFPGVPTVEVYDPASNKWSSGDAMPTKRREHCSVVVGGNVYVFGGCVGPFSSASQLNTVEMLCWK
jgi:N-acetylneuraminic acid mutarotase